jgi:hypothetical protein
MDRNNQRHSLNPDFGDEGDDSSAANEMTLKMSQL